MGNQQATEIEISWLAGIWDGEGTISVRHNKKINQYSPRISMVNTNAKMVRVVSQILNSLNIAYYIREKGQGGFPGSTKQCWILSMDTLTSAQKFLDCVGPYLIAKSDQAQLLEKFVNSRINRRKEVSRNSDCTYNKEELNNLTKLYLVNGDQRKSSETTREAVRKLN